MGSNRELLRELSEEVAKLEQHIYELRFYSERNPKGLSAQKKSPPKNGARKWLILVAVIAVLFFYTFDFDIRLLPVVIISTLTFGLIPLILAFRANKAYRKKRSEWDAEQAAEQEAVQRLMKAEELREQCVKKLREMCEADPSLDGDYWWKADWDPVLAETQLPGFVPDLNEWKLAWMNHPFLERKEKLVHLADMEQTPVTIREAGVDEILDGGAVLYRRDDILEDRDQDFLISHLYAYAVEPIQEVRKNTTWEKVDREAEMDAYRQGQDELESWLNLMGGEGFIDNDTRLLMGNMSANDYLRESMFRDLREMDYEDKLNARPDYEENTRYTKGFYGLSRIRLYNCADILLSTSEAHPGECAAIVLPRENQRILQMIVRSGDKNDPFVGRLEYYRDEPGYRQTNALGKPSVRMAAEILFDPDVMENLDLAPRDVLAERPEGLSPLEFAYLMVMNKN